jgi:hypothetical protein
MIGMMLRRIATGFHAPDQPFLGPIWSLGCVARASQYWPYCWEEPTQPICHFSRMVE